MGSKHSTVPLVVHVIYSLGAGGLENGLVNLINRTPKDRYRHAIVCLTETGRFRERIEDPAVEVLALHASPGHSFRLYWNLWRILRPLGPSIVHTRNLSALEAQIPAFFLKGVKTVHGVHGRDVFDLEGRNRKYNLLRKLIRPLVGRYITVSKDLQNWLAETVGVGKERITQIYNGVDLSVFHPGDKPGALAPVGFLSENSLVIGTVGRLAAVKDQATLIEAFALLLNEAPDARRHLRLMIVGDGPQRAALEALVERLEISDFVWMAGDRSDIPELLRLFDLFVLPSLGEGISNTILEAMATGLPIIATDVGGNPELVRSGVNGYLVPPADPDELAFSIRQLMESGELRGNMGAASLESVRNGFNWDDTVAAYMGVYGLLVGS